MSESISQLIIRNLLYNKQYADKVYPYLDADLFETQQYQLLFNQLRSYVETYKEYPTSDILKIEIDNTDNLNQETVNEAKLVLDKAEANKDKEDAERWLIDTSEKWIKDRKLFNAIKRSVKIMGNDDKLTTDAIPGLLKDALSITFDERIGHNYIDDIEARYEYYHTKEKRIPFDLDMFNKITAGGTVDKSLNLIMAGTGVGKSLVLCHLAARWLLAGYNVVYITLEMSEERIAERIDANLLNVPIQDIRDLLKNQYMTKMQNISKNIMGKLFIKEYPPTQASPAMFVQLLNELNLKQGFKPDIMIVDYLNLCASSRFRASHVNSYQYVKSIAEELRGLAVEHELPIWTATQSNRNGIASSDVDITDVSESIGLPATVDLMLAAIRTEELDEMNMILFKQLKNRYNDLTYYRNFVVGIDRSKMLLYDVEQGSQNQDSAEDVDDKPLFDSSGFGEGMKAEKFNKTEWKF